MHGGLKLHVIHVAGKWMIQQEKDDDLSQGGLILGIC
jgi:hypothetical protein